MLEKCQSAKERWGGVSELIDRWLQERQDLLGLFVALPQKELGDDVVEMLRSFSQILVDYASSWHFGVYEHLLAEADEFNDGGIELAKDLDPKIRATTDTILNFNDQYSEVLVLKVQDVVHLSERLSVLGEALAERFELEDQLIERLHTAHKNRI
ncbi:Rsd/AlgQ family anti-sigma factor [Motiliproteus sp. MSK22-1]|uniref:Rsd/AlgQ family anti-sigma factor n=1 Tax=Motiliproteus sp. MSK22-1 TaxID=1897630 RepID=UPI000977CA9E|nr:Rsd/AlgQ family anti-sigma factor [Motiliproteus sp. MSK22-1]OMH39669.1 anti-RNA polymerase sigma 70 factor [Motiliproteus sp. MSK22-1]